MLSAAGRALRQALGARGAAGQQLLGSQALRAFGAPAGHHDDHDDDHHEPSYDHTPTVFDNLVSINVVDLQGHKHTIRGLVGKSLSQTLIEAGFPAVSGTFGTGLLLSLLLNLNTDVHCPTQTYFFPNMGFYTQHIVGLQKFSISDPSSQILQLL
jgi:hypothetical protein